MDITFDEDGRSLCVTFYGELDHHAAKEVISRLNRRLELCMPLNLTLDMVGVTFMDSSGIAVLMSAYKRMREVEGNMKIKNVPQQAKRVIKAAGVEKMIGGIHI